ncbi:hypothetical protein KGF57_003778 [Candida theae]|uniref:Uncharacterized protein n=1 Tax=Candida theae TaxID=1198502 RepID=A0AAD5BCQ4_9ASCO|nr:uncharacterized protein KGF57_003778 [Candida theae]KAI5954755.1 hypothetical protein KGF57_003778 [Candida theae]
MFSRTMTSTSMTCENALEHLINQSWEQCVGSGDKIYVKQVPVLVTKMEEILAIDSTFTKIVRDSLSDFVAKNPMSKFNKSDARKVIMSSISPKEFASTLRNKYGLTDEVVWARINTSKTAQNDTFHIWKRHQDTAELRSKSMKDEEIENLKKEVAILRQANSEKEIQLRTSAREIDRLNTRVKSLTASHRDRGDGERSLAAQLADKDAALVESAQQCKKFKDACIEYKQREKETALAFKTLEKEIEKQNEVVSFLQSKLPVEKGSNAFKDFLKNLPIVKESFIFLKYRHELKNKRLLLTSVLSIICMFLLMVNLVSVIYYLLLPMVGSFGKGSGIVYMEEEEKTRSPGLLDLMSAIPSVEKFIYECIDW